MNRKGLCSVLVVGGMLIIATLCLWWLQRARVNLSTARSTPLPVQRLHPFRSLTRQWQGVARGRVTGPPIQQKPK